MGYTDIKIKFIQDLIQKYGKKWQEITDEYNSEFEDTKTANALRKAYGRYSDLDISDDTLIKNLEQVRRTSVENKRLKKTQTVLIDKNLEFKEVLFKIETLIKSEKFRNLNIPKIKVDSSKKAMVIEPLISDIHFGIKTKSYNSEKAREAIRNVAKVVLEEKSRYEKIYNISKFNLLLNGDLIQSATMHKDSHSGCELTNAEQLALAIESLFVDLILPLASTGYPMTIVAMAGNHDRESSDRFTVDPGKQYYTYTIYRALELLCQQIKLTKVNFVIPIEAFHVYEILGSHFLVEHGDLLGSKLTMSMLEQQINKRSVQVGKLIKGIRIGHFHNDVIGNIGRYIVNGSAVSDDHFASGLGFKSRPCQLINYYVETNNRETPYYHTLVVNLE